MVITNTRTHRRFNFFGYLALICCIVSSPLMAEDMLVKKQHFKTLNFKTTSGTVLPLVDIGWEAYGTLNSAKDNAILVAHYFTGNSHAAGKYSKDDKNAGYWDSIIGPGKAIDTNKYYVISSDSLVNGNVKDPNVFTTGPSTINPKTQKPYGLDFPVITIRDMVNAQHALITSLDIKKLHAVAGASMGSHQALEWAAAYPEMVPKVLSVIGIGETDSFAQAVLSQATKRIKQDPTWYGGDYYGKSEPTAALAGLLEHMLLHSQHGAVLDQHFKKVLYDDPATRLSIKNELVIVPWLEKAALKRASQLETNHMLYLTRAVQLFRVGHKATLEEGVESITAKVLFLPSKNDMLLPVYNTKKIYNIMKKQGKDVTYEEIDGPWGHLDGIFTIAQKSDTIKKFLAN